MVDNRTIIATLHEGGYLNRCIHDTEELYSYTENPGDISDALLPHGLVTQKELDEN